VGYVICTTYGATQGEESEELKWEEYEVSVNEAWGEFKGEVLTRLKDVERRLDDMVAGASNRHQLWIALGALATSFGVFMVSVAGWVHLQP
jgi:hypothetical protein